MKKFLIEDQLGGILELQIGENTQHVVITSDQGVDRQEIRETSTALLPISTVSTETVSQLTELLSVGKKTHQNIPDLLNTHGFRVLEGHLPTPEAHKDQVHVAKTLYESNVIEGISEASQEALLTQILSHHKHGHVGAHHFLQKKALHDEVLAAEDVFFAHGLLFDEQELLGHKLKPRDLSPGQSQKMMMRFMQEIQGLDEEEVLEVEKRFQQEADSLSNMNRRAALRDEWVTIAGVPVSPPKPQDFEKLLSEMENELSQGLQQQLPKEQMIEIIAKYHLLFENMHPFIDGNGRIGRLIVHYLLKRAGMSELLLPYSRREDYYACFQTQDHQAMTVLFRDLLKVN